MTSKSIFMAALMGAAALFNGSLPALAQDEGPAAEESIIEEEAAISGAEEYIRYCSVCHGLDGKGGGPLAETLKVKPADLTLISKHHNGGFPLGKVVDIIRNGGAVAGHGSRDMPAWGEVFRDHEEPVFASALILELALYLESIQEK